jgi:hypothetical protein
MKQAAISQLLSPYSMPLFRWRSDRDLAGFVFGFGSCRYGGYGPNPQIRPGQTMTAIGATSPFTVASEKVGWRILSFERRGGDVDTA